MTELLARSQDTEAFVQYVIWSRLMHSIIECLSDKVESQSPLLVSIQDPPVGRIARSIFHTMP